MRVCVPLSPFQSFWFSLSLRMRLFLCIWMCVCVYVLKCLLAVNKYSNIMVICMNVTGQENFSELHIHAHTLYINRIFLANANAHSNIPKRKENRQLGNSSNVFPSYLRSNLIPLHVLSHFFPFFVSIFHICLERFFPLFCLIPFHSWVFILPRIYSQRVYSHSYIHTNCLTL